MKESWDWDKLSAQYLNSAHLNIDSDAIASHLNPTPVSKPHMDAIEGNDHFSHVELDSIDITQESASTTTELLAVLPSSKVRNNV